MECGELNFKVNDEEVTFNICNSMKQPKEYQVVSYIDVIENAVASVEESYSIGGSHFPQLC